MHISWQLSLFLIYPVVICELDNNVPPVNEKDIAMIFFDRSNEDGHSTIVRPIIQSFSELYDITDTYVQAPTGNSENKTCNYCLN